MTRNSTVVFEFDFDFAKYAKKRYRKIIETLVNLSNETASADFIVNTYVNSIAKQFEHITTTKLSVLFD